MAPNPKTKKEIIKTAYNEHSEVYEPIITTAITVPGAINDVSTYLTRSSSYLEKVVSMGSIPPEEPFPGGGTETYVAYGNNGVSPEACLPVDLASTGIAGINFCAGKPWQKIASLIGLGGKLGLDKILNKPAQAESYVVSQDLTYNLKVLKPDYTANLILGIGSLIFQCIILYTILAPHFKKIRQGYRLAEELKEVVKEDIIPKLPP